MLLLNVLGSQLYCNLAINIPVRRVKRDLDHLLARHFVAALLFSVPHLSVHLSHVLPILLQVFLII